MKDLKSSIISLKAKSKDARKEKQALAALAKSLRDKINPLMEENNDLKLKIKSIEGEYNANVKIIEKLKEVITNQETIITQLKETDKKREVIMKKCEEKTNRIGKKLYKYKETQEFDKTSLAALYRELYLEYVGKEETKFQHNPEIVGELGKQIQHLQEKKISLEKNNKAKCEQLTKQSANLRKDNAKLIDNLNETRKRLQEVTIQKLAVESKLKSSSVVDTSMRMSSSLPKFPNMNISRNPTIEKLNNSIFRPCKTRQCNLLI